MTSERVGIPGVIGLLQRAANVEKQTVVATCIWIGLNWATICVCTFNKSCCPSFLDAGSSTCTVTALLKLRSDKSREVPFVLNDHQCTSQ
eukprot:735129-Amphidinium_carterae.1